MKNENYSDIIIIGAGVAGLVAAKKCEDSGYSVLLLESDKKEGGRVQTDSVDGYALERGFQVLIDSYEKAQELLDYEELDLCQFDPGAKIFDEKGNYSIADPLRKMSAIFGTAFSRVGSLSDKLNLLRLTRQLQSKSLKEVFEGKQESTLHYLEQYGFSGKMIENFFRPFFGGIFLERELRTDAAMFRFVFRNFSKGNACIPAKGMEKIPMQLKLKLKTTNLKFNTKVAKVNQDASVELEDGTLINAKKVIIACNPDHLLPQLDHPIGWEKTTTMYFSGKKTLPSMDQSIGLDARKKSSINNFARHDEILPQSAPADRSLWSVTTRGEHDQEIVKKDLAELLDINSSSLRFVKQYIIPRALPKVAFPALALPPEQSKVTDHIYLAGDYLTNASIDGAMRSGESAAIAVTETLDLIN